MTGAGGALEADIAADHAGVLNLLRWLTVLRDRPAPKVGGPFRSITELTAPADGFAEPVHELGDEVESGERLVRVLTQFGDTAAVVAAPSHGDSVGDAPSSNRPRWRELVCGVAARVGPETT